MRLTRERMIGLVTSRYDVPLKSNSITVTNQVSCRSGIDFVCSSCHTVLYHIGFEAENVGDTRSHYPKDSIFTTLNECTKCGRELNFDIDPDLVKILPATIREFAHAWK